MTARERIQELSRGASPSGAVVVPLALAPAARIQEREWEDFTEDPTQLANGLRDLVDAVRPDGVPVTSARLLVEQAAGSLVPSPHAVAAVEATRRLRQSMDEALVLAAVLPGVATFAAAGIPEPAAQEQLLDLGKQLLAAGVDLVVVDDGDAPPPDVNLSTLGNVARFHQALAVATRPLPGGLPPAARVPFDSPRAVDGVAVTAEELTRDTDLTELMEWMDAVRG